MASVVVTMDAREAALFRAQQKIVDQQVKMNAKFAEGGNTSERASKQTKDGFDKSAFTVKGLTSSLTSYVAGVGLAAGAVQSLQAAWIMVRKEQEAGLAQLQRTSSQDRRLLQVAGSAEEFTKLRNQSDSLAASSGVDRGVVREVMFSAISEGFRDAVPEIIAAAQVIDPVAAAGVAGQVPALFKGAISALEAVDLTLRAAKESRLNFEQISSSLPQAAEGGGIAKATAQETLAVLSVLASEFKSGDTAADRMKMFATKAGISDEFAGQGLIAPLEKLMGMDEKTRRKYLGDSQELNVAYVKMAENLPLIKQRLADLNAESTAFAAGGGILRSQSEIAANDPQLAAVRAEAKARQDLERTQAQRDGVSGGSAAAAELITTKQILTNGSFFSRFINNITGLGGTVARGASTSGLSTDASSTLGAASVDVLSGLANPFSSSSFSALEGAAKSMFESSINLNDAAARISTGTPAARAQAAGAAN